LRYPPGRDDSPQETAARLKLLMEDVSDALDAESASAAVRAGVRVWRFLPTCAEVVEAAKEFIADRSLRRKIEREAREAAERKALPAPVYADPDDCAAILAKCYADLSAGYQNMEGRPMPQRRPMMAAVSANVSTALRMPTADELAEVARILAGKPRVEKMTITDADYSALGMGVAARA